MLQDHRIEKVTGMMTGQRTWPGDQMTNLNSVVGVMGYSLMKFFRMVKVILIQIVFSRNLQKR